jgi:hypothetical protein
MSSAALIPGGVMLIARGGQIGFADAFGYRDREAGAPMTLDAIFRNIILQIPFLHRCGGYSQPAPRQIERNVLGGLASLSQV